MQRRAAARRRARRRRRSTASRCEVVAVDIRARDAEEERSGRDGARVVGEVADLERSRVRDLVGPSAAIRRSRSIARSLATGWPRLRAPARPAAPPGTAGRTSRSARTPGAATTPPKMGPCGSSTVTSTTSRGFVDRHHADERGDVLAGRVAVRRPASARCRSCRRRCSRRSRPRCPSPPCSSTTPVSIVFSCGVDCGRDDARVLEIVQRAAADAVDEVRLRPRRRRSRSRHRRPPSGSA